MLVDMNSWVGMLASIATLISFLLNLYQWRTSANLKKHFYSKVFAEWNLMYRIAELADEARITYDKKDVVDQEKLGILIRKFEQATGISDSARQELLAFSEKYLGKPIWRQHPAQPT